MGVPAFYRWLTRRYPLIIADAVEDDLAALSGGLEYDNFYLDMNGIVHLCFHPEGKPAPLSYDEVFHCIFQCIDRLVAIVRPRKLLYMAIDGVAPRAKMNQQRSRRFRAAKEALEVRSFLCFLFHLLELSCYHFQVQKRGETSDSNVITPGTEFMALLSDALSQYVQLRLSESPGWQRMKVILSDANVPGEGEHKIFYFIRMQRNLPGFDPNTRHCLYGLDADLVMLALATHEVHFSILREVPCPRKCYLCGEVGHIAKHCDGTQKSTLEETEDVSYQFLHIWLLREYLELELKIADADFERIVDDFVFICFFVGNDFLPGLPTLDIRQGAIGMLLSVYKQEFSNMSGYLTETGEVNLRSLEYFLEMVGQIEDGIIQKQFQKSWKATYYEEKFGSEYSEELKKGLAQKYTEGLCWILHYYYRGVSSWQWYYPYHYAPFASDLAGLGAIEVRFEAGKPLKPFDMLMGVLPASSAWALPEYYRLLMTNPASPLIDFYPEEFVVDMNGKQYPWQGVVKLPFINVERLLVETRKLEGTLSASEIKRNSIDQELLFLCCHQPLARYIYACVEDTEGICAINPIISEGLNGFLTLNRGALEAAVPHNVLCVNYICPSNHPHIPSLPDGVILPAKSIVDRDFRRHSHRGRQRSTSSGSSDPYREHGSPSGRWRGRRSSHSRTRSVDSHES
ncbi:5'-3' exoribonuclease 2-like [Selaginella moellendorffii]|uniref:5'-3' exoribonuclease 2-like n=1 Tax=Selaginella moellendorffii TaxID=88036 RepID=UPI000D1C5A93|nr:5'-3' exoribonuclease 2-like [Selaginella moellendorffii]|eukprot:XP_024519073.1 5'-3' exoribonuclease 2-like [Selaginella moellendorffii]